MSDSTANKSVSRRNVRCAKRVVRRGSAEDTTEQWYDAVESLSAMPAPSNNSKMSNSIANKSVSRRNVRKEEANLRCAKRFVRRGSAEDTTEEWHDAVEFEDTTEEWHDAVESLSAMQLESIKQNKARKASPRCAKRVVRRRGQQVDSSLSAAENRTRTTRVRWQDPIVSSVMLIPGRAVEEERDAQDLGVEEPEVIVAPAPRRRAQTKRRATPGSRSQRPKTSLRRSSRLSGGDAPVKYRRSSRLSGGDAPVNARRSLRLRSKPTTRYPA